jgi:hypothetical protein
MLRSNREKQQAYEFVSIEELVPQDHLLRKVDKYIDFSFIDEKVRQVLQNTRDYVNELNAAVEADRNAHGKKR